MKRELFQALRTGDKLPNPHSIDLNGLIEEMWNEYYDASMQMLDAIEQKALQLESGRQLEENTRSIKQMLHTLKGQSGMAGLKDIHNLCHEAESIFEETEQMIDSVEMLLRTRDWIAAALDYANSAGGKRKKTKIPAHAVKGSLRILVVDDDPVSRTLAKMVFEKLGTCETAENGQQAVEKYIQSLQEGSPYSLITLDYQMPGLNGIQTLHTLRSEEKSRHITGARRVKIVILTGENVDEPIFETLKAGRETVSNKNSLRENFEEIVSSLKLKIPT